MCSQAARPLGCGIQQGGMFRQSLRKAKGQSNTIVPSHLRLDTNPHPSISGSQFILFSGTNLSFPGGKVRQGGEPHLLPTASPNMYPVPEKLCGEVCITVAAYGTHTLQKSPELILQERGSNSEISLQLKQHRFQNFPF